MSIRYPSNSWFPCRTHDLPSHKLLTDSKVYCMLSVQLQDGQFVPLLQKKACLDKQVNTVTCSNDYCVRSLTKLFPITLHSAPNLWILTPGRKISRNSFFSFPCLVSKMWGVLVPKSNVKAYSMELLGKTSSHLALGFCFKSQWLLGAELTIH